MLLSLVFLRYVFKRTVILNKDDSNYVCNRFYMAMKCVFLAEYFLYIEF